MEELLLEMDGMGLLEDEEEVGKGESERDHEMRILNDRVTPSAINLNI